MVIGLSFTVESPLPAEGTTKYDFSSGRLCLDFANTVPTHPASPSDPAHPDVHPDFATFADLVRWSREAMLIDDETAEALARNAMPGAAAAEEWFERALALREAVYRLVIAAIGERPAADTDVATLNAELRRAMGALALEASERGFSWRFAGDVAPVDRILAPVALSAAALLTSPEDLERVRHCGGDRCDWLFYDTSRNRSRRWCSMSGCGNRAKAKRHYQRTKVGRQQ